jgi:hypothetical protein
MEPWNRQAATLLLAGAAGVTLGLVTIILSGLLDRGPTVTLLGVTTMVRRDHGGHRWAARHCVESLALGVVTTLRVPSSHQTESAPRIPPGAGQGCW